MLPHPLTDFEITKVPGIPKKTSHVFKSLFFDVMWSKYYKIFRGCSGIIF